MSAPTSEETIVDIEPTIDQTHIQSIDRIDNHTVNPADDQPVNPADNQANSQTSPRSHIPSNAQPVRYHIDKASYNTEDDDDDDEDSDPGTGRSLVWGPLKNLFTSNQSGQLASSGPLISSIPTGSFGAATHHFNRQVVRGQSEKNVRPHISINQSIDQSNDLIRTVDPTQTYIVDQPDVGSNNQPNIREEAKENDIPRAIGSRIPDQPINQTNNQSINQTKTDDLDPDVRDLLDPNSKSKLSVDQLMTWPREKIISLVTNLQIEHVEILMQKRQAQLDDEYNQSIKQTNKQSNKQSISQPIKPPTLSWRNLYYQAKGSGRLLLQNVSGYVKPGQIVGILGGPDAGITTLLDVLALKQKGPGLIGDIFCDRRPPDHLYHRSVGYVSKYDVHLSNLTVSETVYFSARLRNPNMTKNMALLKTAFILKLLGLLHTWNTVVGDDLIRGISGGEKRRLSFALELVAGHSLILADLPTNGLDAGGALSLMRLYRSLTTVGRSMVCSLVQPSPAIFALLDNVVVLSKGACLYFGPPSMALQHFESAGFIKPSTKTIPQFLEELSAAPEHFVGPGWLERPLPTMRRPLLAFDNQSNNQLIQRRSTATNESDKSDAQQRPSSSSTPAAWSAKDVVVNVEADQPINQSINQSINSKALSHQHVTPYRAWKRLVDAYESSVFAADVGYVLYHEMVPVPVFGKPHKRKHKHKQTKNAKTLNDVDDGAAAITTSDSNVHSSRYESGFWLQYQENFHRLFTLFYRQRALWIYNWIKSLLMGLIVGSLFYQLSLTQGNVRSRFGLVYFMLTFNTANGQQLVPVLLNFRRVFQMQKTSAYYRPFSYYLAFTTIQIPLAAIETFLFLVVLYPLAGLQGNVGSDQFGFAYLMILLTNLVARGFIVFITALCPTEALVNILNGLTLVIFSIFSGYLNPLDSIPDGWVWAYYISYYTWALRGMMINEQVGLTYECDTNPCQYPTGEAALELYDMSGGNSDKWLCVLWMALFLVGFNLLGAYCMANVNLVANDHEEEPDFQARRDAATLSRRKSRRSMRSLPVGAGVSTKQIEMTAPASRAASFASAPQTELMRAGYISWNKLSYSVTVEGGERALLTELSGFAAPGMMVALMGASGAGKSTLLDVLAGRKTAGTVSGQILVNGAPQDPASFARVAAYVQQFSEDHHEKSTVREAVRFSAMLRLPRSITVNADEVETRVDRVLAQVGLTALQHDLIGNASTGGVNQAARKKVTIAVELVTEPSILFLDEPTTGLDSASALDVMSVVAGLRESMAVVCTIHQPSEEVFHCFDWLCMLQPGGKLCYYGPVGEIENYFRSLGFPACGPHENVADYAVGMTKTNSKISFPDAFMASSLGKQSVQRIEAGIAPASVAQQWEVARAAAQKDVSHSNTPAPFTVQFSLLLTRFARGLVRSPDLYIGRLFAQVLMSFIIGTCFFQLGNGQKDTQNRVSAVFMTVQFAMGTGAMKLPAVFSERALVFRERQANMYTHAAYYLARLLHDIPLWLVENFIFAVMVYFICDLNQDDNSARFGLFYLLLLITAQLGFATAELIAMLSSAPPMAYVILGIQSTIFSLFSGFMIVKSNIPDWWIWMHYLTPNKYALTAGLQNEMRGQSFVCDDSLLVTGAAPLCGIDDPTFRRCPLQCGDELLSAQGLETSVSNEAMNFGLIVVFAVGFRIIGMLAFRYVNYVKR